MEWGCSEWAGGHLLTPPSSFPSPAGGLCPSPLGSPSPPAAAACLYSFSSPTLLHNLGLLIRAAFCSSASSALCDMRLLSPASSTQLVLGSLGLAVCSPAAPCYVSLCPHPTSQPGPQHPWYCSTRALAHQGLSTVLVQHPCISQPHGCQHPLHGDCGREDKHL